MKEHGYKTNILYTDPTAIQALIILRNKGVTYANLSKIFKMTGMALYYILKKHKDEETHLLPQV